MMMFLHLLLVLLIMMMMMMMMIDDNDVDDDVDDELQPISLYIFSFHFSRIATRQRRQSDKKQGSSMAASRPTIWQYPGWQDVGQ